jgi:hypothetical protein
MERLERLEQLKPNYSGNDLKRAQQLNGSTGFGIRYRSG